MPSLPLVARRVVVLAAFAAALASGQGAARADRVALEDGTHVVGTATVDSASKIVTVAPASDAGRTIVKRPCAFGQDTLTGRTGRPSRLVPTMTPW